MGGLKRVYNEGVFEGQLELSRMGLVDSVWVGEFAVGERI